MGSQPPGTHPLSFLSFWAPCLCKTPQNDNPPYLFLRYRVFEIISMDLLEIWALVSIFLRRLHSSGVSNKNLTNSRLDFFPDVMRQTALGFPGCFTCMTFFRDLPFSQFLGEECGRTGCPQAFLPGFSSLRPFSFVASIPSLLFIRQSPRSGFDFAQTCSLGVSLDRFDMFLLTRCKYHKRSVGRRSMCQSGVSIRLLRTLLRTRTLGEHVSNLLRGVHVFNLSSFHRQ